MRIQQFVLALAAGMASAVAGLGQEDIIVTAPKAAWMAQDAGTHALSGAVQFISADMVDGKIVKGAPYSGESMTEVTRLLADGTRIVNKHSTMLARDKEGRTRRESSIAMPLPGGAQAPRIVTIIDPVARETIILNLNDKTARRMKAGQPAVFRSESTGPNGAREVREERVHVEMRTGTAAAAGSNKEFNIAIAGPGEGGSNLGAAVFMRHNSRNSRTENLGRQVMEGVPVEGTRVTSTIPAGEIGNDRSINSVTEKWSSPDLQMTVFSKTNDPQFGETIYRVSNLRRSEPSADLFKIPSDFRIEEGGSQQMIRRREVK